MSIHFLNYFMYWCLCYFIYSGHFTILTLFLSVWYPPIGTIKCDINTNICDVGTIWFLYILNLNNKQKFRVPSNVMVGIIICEIGTIMCDIGTINMRFYLLEVPYPHGYCKITLIYSPKILQTFKVGTSLNTQTHAPPSFHITI